MLKLIGLLFTGLIVIILSEWLFGGILNVVGSIAYRSHSIFTGEWDVPVSKLRQRHDDSIWPWVIVSCLFVGLVMLVFAI